jgi:hypothetical protein
MSTYSFALSLMGDFILPSSSLAVIHREGILTPGSRKITPEIAPERRWTGPGIDPILDFLTPRNFS